MKKSFLLFLCFVSSFSFMFAQIPQGINYQAVARDANGNAQTNATIAIRFTIRKTTSAGTVEWQELHSPITTNSMGQFTCIIGTGVRQNISAQALFSDINWASDVHFLEAELQTGLFTFVSLGNSPLMSVPYSLSAPDPTPAGVISAFGGSVAPSGYLLCQGQAVSRTGIYAKLFAAIGVAYGAGDGSTTFNVPDFRGMFLRGLDGVAGNDPDKSTRTASATGGNTGNNLGSKQTDEFKSHTHTAAAAGVTTFAGGQAGWGFYGGGSASFLNPTGGSETRPKNVYVNYIIKY
ncbi:MAG: phage tail protein [Bacteroidota bacterium]|jgi:microcystin-dependent protein